MRPNKVLEQKLHNLIAEDDTVMGDGSIVTERDGKVETSYFADVYKIKDGKITELQSYMVMEKNNEK